MKTPQEKWVENRKIKNAVFRAFRAQKMTFVQIFFCHHVALLAGYIFCFNGQDEGLQDLELRPRIMIFKT